MHEQESLQHIIRAAEAEFDRLANAEVHALLLEQRRRRKLKQLANRKLVKAPMHPPSLEEVGAVQRQTALSVAAAPKKDRRAAMQHFDAMARKQIRELEERLTQQTEKSVDEVRMRQRTIAEIELERLFRDQKVERELLSKDINQHYARMFSEGTLDMGFTEQVLLLYSKKYQDPQKTEQMRADLNLERDQRLTRALTELEARHAEDIAHTKSEQRKRARLAEAKVREEGEAHQTAALARARSRIANARLAKDKKLLADESEATQVQSSFFLFFLDFAEA